MSTLYLQCTDTGIEHGIVIVLQILGGWHSARPPGRASRASRASRPARAFRAVRASRAARASRASRALLLCAAVTHTQCLHYKLLTKLILLCLIYINSLWLTAVINVTTANKNILRVKNWWWQFHKPQTKSAIRMRYSTLICTG